MYYSTTYQLVYLIEGFADSNGPRGFDELVSWGGANKLKNSLPN